MERYRRSSGAGRQKADKGDFKKKLKKQAIVCSVIFGVIFLSGFLKTETAVKFNERVGGTLSYTVDYKGAVQDIAKKLSGFAKEVQNVSEDADSSR